MTRALAPAAGRVKARERVFAYRPTKPADEVYRKSRRLLYWAWSMSYVCRLASAPWTALVLALCAGCDGAQQGGSGSSSRSSESPAAVTQEFAFDRQAPGSANQVPALEGTPGTLRYRPGCLFLDAGGGDEIGLVVSADAIFDGRRLIGKLRTPAGQPVVREIGQFVSFSGPVIENPKDGRYSCDTKRVLITDYF